MAGNKRWTDDEVDYLKKYYGAIDIEEIANKTKRSIDAIHWKASQLGIKHSETSDVITHLIRIEKLLEEIAYNTSKRSPIRPFTADEVIFIKEKNGFLSKRQMAKDLKIPENSFYTMFYNLVKDGVVKNKQKIAGKLTEEEALYIKENYLKNTYREIAEHLNIPTHKVIHYVSANLPRKNRKI